MYWAIIERTYVLVATTNGLFVFPIGDERLRSIVAVNPGLN
jgi:hypothetical protein